jgi:predicted dinucleotide-binding enzyme
MKIGIIGAGNIGSNLARRLVGLGHEVAIANSRDPETLADLVVETGVNAVTAAEAPHEADLVIVSVPLKAIADLPKGLLDGTAPGAPIIDTNNYYPKQRDGRIEAIEAGATEARWVSDQLGRPTIKVFNNIYAGELLSRPTPPGTTGRRALPVAGDDAAAKAVVLTLVDDLGFDAVDVGGLDDSWRYQPGQPAYGPDVDAAVLAELLATAQLQRRPEFSG